MEEIQELTGLEIAVIGMSGRFPGAETIDRYWQNLVSGLESLYFYTSEELETAGVEPEKLEKPNYIKCGGGILEHIDAFDAAFFDYTPTEATVMHPQVRLFHEQTWEALENAGYNPYSYTGKIGLYAGASSSFGWETQLTLSGKVREMGPFVTSMLANSNFLSTRIAYKLNLKGPAVAIQSACSTSLLTIDLASRGILTGQCDMAIAGGVSVSGAKGGPGTKPAGYMYREGLIRSEDGHCRAFDAKAKGTIDGEGVGVVVLKLLEDAQADGDTIHAIIKGFAANNDGNRKVGYTAPSIEGQTEVIRAAHLMAEVAPESISYIETHGTGTTLGDPVEIEALKQGFNTDKKGYCKIGSVKTNIGHLDAAAGIASFIKVVLALKHKQIPPSIHFQSPNPKAGLENSPFVVNTSLSTWERASSPLRAGVSSFGIGGTNIHIILEEAPKQPLHQPSTNTSQLILLSAKTQTALEKMTQNLLETLQQNNRINLSDMVYTLQVGRNPFRYRHALIATDTQEAIAQLTQLQETQEPGNEAGEETQPVVFLFSGQGAQYVNMGRELYEQIPLFRQYMEHCYTILKPLMNCDTKEILYPTPENNPEPHKINRTEITQPLLFVIEYALASLLMHWGIKPYAMMGHSIGEYVAAHLSGVFTLEEALKIVVQRGKLMGGIPSGSMLGVRQPENQLLKILPPEISLAGINSPTDCTVSGPTLAIEKFAQQLKANGIQARNLHTSHAFHSAMMEPILDTYTSKVREIPLQRPKIPYISNVTGNWITAGDAANPSYWATHLRAPVRFTQGAKELLKKPQTIFIEIGPGNTLTTFINAHITTGQDNLAINLIRHPKEQETDLHYLSKKIGQLWMQGKSIDWKKYHEGEQLRRIPLPTYPFERQSYWPHPGETTAALQQLMAGTGAVPIPGKSNEPEPLDNWYYLPDWKRSPLKPTHPDTEINQAQVKDHWLIFQNEHPLGHLLEKKLKAQGLWVTRITPGPGYAHESDSHHIVKPDQTDDYIQMFRHINEQTETHSKTHLKILHLWTLTGQTEQGTKTENTQEAETQFEHLQNLGIYSLLNIIKAQAKIKLPSNEYIQINVISDHWYDVTGEEDIEPGKRTMTGILNVIPQENPHIRCRSIDIAGNRLNTEQQEIQAQQILAEILQTSEKGDLREPILAIRGPHRLTPGRTPLPLSEPAPEQIPLKQRGVYLITGGLGKIGIILAENLAKDYNARLILTGRTPVTHPETIKKITRLETMGAEVMAIACDTTNRQQMQEAIEQAQQRWGKIDGIIHAAGIIHGKTFNLVNRQAPESFQEQFKAKVLGTLNLSRQFKEKSLDFCILMSSISTTLGGIQFSAYAAANAFMDAMVTQMKREGNTTWYSINWDGMPPKETWASFKRILSVIRTNAMHSRILVSRDGKLDNRVRQWIYMENKTQTTPATTTSTKPKPSHPRPKILTPYIPPTTPQEKALAEIWQHIFGFERIGIQDDFLELGGDSLKAVTLISAIHRQMEVEIPLPVFFSNPTIAKLATTIAARETDNYKQINPVEKREYYPLSSAQKRIYFLQQLDTSTTVYNMPLIYPLDNTTKDKLEHVLNKLISRHESLRTSFHTIQNEPVQRVHDNVMIKITHHSVTVTGAVPAPDSFIRPFDLSQAPLIRSGIIKQPNGNMIWLLDMHHIISDGTSHTILVEDFINLYHQEILEPLKIQYKDFALWQNDLRKENKIKEQENFWLSVFKEEVPRLDLPADQRRPKRFTFTGANYTFELEEEETAKFRELGTSQGGTLYMNILAILNTLFYRYTGQEDIIIGSGMAGRNHSDIQRVVGMFINILALRNNPHGEKSYTTFLEEVISGSIQAFQNQDIQFEELIEKLEPERDPSRNPLFDISMVVQNFRKPGQTAQETQPETSNPAEILPANNENAPQTSFKNKTAKFDQTWFIREIGSKVQVTIEYYTGIFKEATIQRQANHFKNIIKTVINTPQIKLNQIQVMSPEEKHLLLSHFNQTEMDYPRDKSVYELFARQVEQTPHRKALSGPEILNTSPIKSAATSNETENVQLTQLTYHELNRQTQRIAIYIIDRKGIKSGEPLGIWLKPSIDRATATLGTLRAGASYVPLDPSIPRERLGRILKDAGIAILLSEKKYIKELNQLLWEVPSLNSFICLDSNNIQKEEEQETNQLMETELWHHVAETAVDEITGGGWLSSYTGKPISQKEMEEYGDNIFKKLEPLLNPQTRILEIGCASGITMYRIAPKVRLYYGTDLSTGIIEKNKQRNQQENHQNILLKNLKAHEIDQLKTEPYRYNLIIINSVIQCFHGHNYLGKVIGHCIELMEENGTLFIGDVMDLEKKKALLHDLHQFKQNNREKDILTKTDFSNELFISKKYWEDIKAQHPCIEKIEISDKIYTIENELTKYRYDVAITINKKENQFKTGERQKHPEDRNSLPEPLQEWKNPEVTPQSPAYIIYTSGTTGTPKGVVISQKALVNLCYWHTNAYAVTSSDQATLYANFGFDASVWEMYPYLLTGATLHVVEDEIRLNVDLLREFFRKNGITISFLPTQLCEQLTATNNDIGVRALLTGGDKLRTYTPGTTRLYNNYGPTENTVVTTSYWVKEQAENIPIGKPIANTRVYIVLQKTMTLQPPGIPGELCIAGDGLASGYLNQPEMTAEKFSRKQSISFTHPHMPLSNPHSNTQPLNHSTLYRTGDLARWNRQGEIEFLGRIDQQVKIRGNRLELGEIETLLMKLDDVKEAVVVARNNEANEKVLCAYIVPQTGIPTKAVEPAVLKEALAAALPSYMIPAHILLMEKMPLTHSGKVDAKALPIPSVRLKDQDTGPINETEEKLIRLWSEILGIDANRIGRESNFFDLGGHSLKATNLVSRIHQSFSTIIPLADIFKWQTIKEQAKQIRQATINIQSQINPLEKREYYDLSYNQMRLWLIHQKEPDTHAFNMPGIISLCSGLELEIVRESIHRLMTRHESLKTGFMTVGEQAVQYIKDQCENPLKLIDISQMAPEAREIQYSKMLLKETRTPFNLEIPPLFRITVVKRTETDWELIFVLHHIISDGWSQNILIQDFQDIYQEIQAQTESKNSTILQYRDFAHWQKKQITQNQLKERAHRYWKKKLANGIHVLQLPETSNVEHNTQSGSGYRCTIDKTLKNELLEFTRELKTSIFTVMYSLFLLLMSDLSHQTEITCSIIDAGRELDSVHRMIGFFINTIFHMTHIENKETITDLIQRVHEDLMETQEIKLYPPELAFEELNINFPETTVAINMLNMQDQSKESQLENIEPAHLANNRDVKFSLELYLTEYSNGMEMVWAYRNSKLSPGTVEYIASEYIKFVTHFVRNKQSTLEQYRGAGEKRRFKRRR